MGRLDGRVAIVTGAAHGERAALGVVFAKALAAEGASVAICDVKDCSDVAQEIKDGGGEAMALTIDVSDEAQVNELVGKTVAEYGRLDILIPNAAIGSNIPPEPVGQLAVEDWALTRWPTASIEG
jgi:NAD(P)-dependent dehydrogenase (short-subunit alcohol dehydrogenase family)